jgi:hypothetical protein
MDKKDRGARMGAQPRAQASPVHPRAPWLQNRSAPATCVSSRSAPATPVSSRSAPALAPAIHATLSSSLRARGQLGKLLHLKDYGATSRS